MKDHDNPSTDNDRRLLDQLIDGELDGSDRRRLLERLEQLPDGWRRCAMAFLESQCLRETFQHPPASATSDSTPSVPAPRRRRRSPALARFATAVGLMLALTAGWTARSWWRGSDPSTGPRLAENLEPPRDVVASDAPGAKPARDQTWRVVSIPVADTSTGTTRWIDVPAVEQERLNGHWLNGLPSAVSPEVVREMEQAGLDVRRSRRLLPLPLDAEHRVVVPVDELEVEYVGGPAYQ